MTRNSSTRAISSGATLALLTLAVVAQASEYHDACDGPETTWRVSDADLRAAGAKVEHGRNSQIHYEGTGSEQFVFQASRYGTDVGLIQRLPQPARVISD